MSDLIASVGGSIATRIGGAVISRVTSQLGPFGGTGLSLATSAINRFAPQLDPSGLVSAWLRSTSRKIGTIIPDVTVEENHTDRVQVTSHPVAIGSPISDHAFKLPMTLTMRCGWSNSAHSPTYIKDIYAALRDLQGTDKKPIDVINISTGKRTYQNMVLTELTVRTTTETENALIVEAQFTEVIRVTTRSTTQPKTSDLENPPATASPTTQPTQQAQPTAPNAPAQDLSIIRRGGDWIRSLFSSGK